MSDSYDTNEFKEVVRYLDGRRQDDRRDLTGYEEQLLRELAEKDARIDELEIEVESAYTAGYAQGASDE